MSTTLRVQRANRPLAGSLAVPADLEVAHRALLLAALGDGQSELHGVPSGSLLDDTMHFLRELGVPITVQAGIARIQGVGLQGLSMPSGALACGRSWTSLALCAGVLAAQPFGTRITAHASLAQRSVEDIVGPLRARGANIAGTSRGPDTAPTPPISVAPLFGDEHLHALDCTLSRPDAAAKSAVLVSALFATGVTTIAEPLVSADHMERLMVGLGLPLKRIGSVVGFDPGGWNRRIDAMREIRFPGCPTSHAYLLTAALLIPGSAIALHPVGINPSRSGFLDALRLWGADVQVTPRGDAALREPIAEVTARFRNLRGGVLGGEVLARAQTEAPALALLGAFSQRGVEIHDLELCSQPVLDTLARLTTLLPQFGIHCVRTQGMLQVRRQSTIQGARVRCADDPLIAMCALLLGLLADGETVVEEGAEALELAYPGFLDALQTLGAPLLRAPTETP